MNSNERNEGTVRISLITRIIGAVLVSIIIPLLTGFLHGKNGSPLFTSTEQLAVGFFVFLAITMTAVSYDLAELLRLRRSEHELWQIRNEADEWLSNIRASYVTLLNESGALGLNLFAQYFMRIFSAVADDINEAAAKHELRVDELTFGTTDLLIKIMANRGDQTLRLVHALDSRPNNFDFTTWARSYYSELTSLTKEKKIKEIRRLFIYSNEEELNDGFAQTLLAFHASNPGYDFRILNRSDWSQLGRGLGLHEADCEIGIWGEMLGYTCLRSSAVGLQGIYTCLPRQIGRLGELFDAGWRLGEKPAIRVNAGPVTVTDLFKWGAIANSAADAASIPLAGRGLTGEGPDEAIFPALPTMSDDNPPSAHNSLYCKVAFAERPDTSN